MNDGLWNPDKGGIGEKEPLLDIEYNPGFTSPSTAVVEAIASIEDVCPVELLRSGHLTLTDHVDPDILDQLFTGRNTDNIMITFSTDKYTVSLRRGKITIVHIVDSSTDNSG